MVCFWSKLNTSLQLSMKSALPSSSSSLSHRSPEIEIKKKHLFALPATNHSSVLFHLLKSSWHLCMSSLFQSFRAVFKWLSEKITRLRWLDLVIGLWISHQFFNQWETKPKQIAPYTRDFYRALSKLQIIARNSDWFIALFVSVAIGRSNYFGWGFSTVIWKPLFILW